MSIWFISIWYAIFSVGFVVVVGAMMWWDKRQAELARKREAMRTCY